MPTTRMEVERGIYRLYGPLRIKVLSGEALFLGRVLRPGEEIMVPYEHTSSMKITSSTSELEVTSQPISRIERAERGEPLENWLQISRHIVRERYSRVMVMGETDSGKSSFSSFLLNHALSHGLRVAFIDSDVGQNDIGYPGTVALSYIDRPFSWLRGIRADRLYFVGSTTPAGNEDLVILGTRMLMEEALRKADLVVVNTDGWIEGVRARWYKSKFIIALRPDCAVIMKGSGRGRYLKTQFSKFIEILEAETPQVMLGKEREMRKMRREISYVELLHKCTLKVLSLKEIAFVGSYIFTGVKPRKECLGVLDEIFGKDLLHVEVTPEAGILVFRNLKALSLARENYKSIKELLNAKSLIFLTPGQLRGLLVGILGEKMDFAGLGVIQKVDFDRQKIFIMAPVDRSRIRGIVLGRLKISADGSEVGRVNYIV